MYARIWTNILILISLFILAAVSYYFIREYSQAHRRYYSVDMLTQIIQEEGPCGGLEKTREILEQNIGDDFARLIVAKRQDLAKEIVGQQDKMRQRTLRNADRNGLIDRTLCEQIKLTYELGEWHPVMELLRITHESGDPCEDPISLNQALDALTSHKPLMLRALMGQVTKLHCLPPRLSTRIANMILDELQQYPYTLDDLDPLRIARFLDNWSPLRAAQFGCWVQTKSKISQVAREISCTPYNQKNILVQYRYTHSGPHDGAPDTLPPSTHVLLLKRSGNRCEVRPTKGIPRLFMVSCSDLKLISDTHIGVHIEAVHYGLAKASLIAGLAHYKGAQNLLHVNSETPAVQSWFGYDRQGQHLGLTQIVRLSDVAAQLGEKVPEHPLRTFCRRAGARYCYDVDWAKVVSNLRGDPILYLSRPIDIFVPAAHLSQVATNALFVDAFERPLSQNAIQRMYQVQEDAYFLFDIFPGYFEARWRWQNDRPWEKQRFGQNQTNKSFYSARLLAVFDIEQDGKPELLIQKVFHAALRGTLRVKQDEIVLLHMENSGRQFRQLNKLVVHEY